MKANTSTYDFAQQLVRPRDTAIGLFTDADFSGVHAENGELSPTTECMLYWVVVYKIMNRCLFGGKLPNCMITLERKGSALGYFRPNSFKNRNGEIVHQIAMNPDFFEPLGDLEALRTFAHEMCHLWREMLGPRNCNGSNGTRGYHCRAWGRTMEEIGLMPSHTGKPGGRKTGYQMADYVIRDSKFDLLSQELLESGKHVEWRDASKKHVSATQAEDVPDLEGLLLMPEGGASAAASKPTKNRQSRAKYTCPNPECGQTARGGHKGALICGFCDLPMRRDTGRKA